MEFLPFEYEAPSGGNISTPAEPKSRFFSREQVAEMVKRLSSGAKGSVIISLPRGPRGPSDFGQEIMQILSEAEWPNLVLNKMLYVERISGVELCTCSKVPAHAVVLGSAFKAAGMDTKCCVDDNIPEGMVGIVVGHRPARRNLCEDTVH